MCDDHLPLAKWSSYLHHQWSSYVKCSSTVKCSSQVKWSFYGKWSFYPHGKWSSQAKWSSTSQMLFAYQMVIVCQMLITLSVHGQEVFKWWPFVCEVTKGRYSRSPSDFTSHAILHRIFICGFVDSQTHLFLRTTSHALWISQMLLFSDYLVDSGLRCGIKWVIFMFTLRKKWTFPPTCYISTPRKGKRFLFTLLLGETLSTRLMCNTHIHGARWKVQQRTV